ncbi:hypothetical protein BZJ79_01815 [Staphylococcus aureus]|nr:hypothetical protein BZJ79_01815 [Staphylococcus aureus]ORT80808.1 hypothetical protein B6V77_01955 [Staphylococcus aureus]
MPVEFLFEILYVGAPPTCIVCRNYGSNFSLLGPAPQLAHYCKLTFRQLLCWGPANKRCSDYYFG